MTEKNNAVCSICGKPYYKCISCKDLMNLRPWQVRTCSSGHYQVSQVVRGFTTGVYTKDEAKEKFKNIDITDLESYRDNIRDIIKDILKEKKVVEPIVEVEIETADNDDIINVEEVVEKPVYSRKRNIKVENIETEIE